MSDPINTRPLEELLAEIADLLIGVGLSVKAVRKADLDTQLVALDRADAVLGSMKNLIDGAITEIGVMQDSVARRH